MQFKKLNVNFKEINHAVIYVINTCMKLKLNLLSK